MKTEEQILKELKEKGSCNMFGLFTIFLKDGRKGTVKCGFLEKTEYKPRYAKRLVYKTSPTLKEKINSL